MGRIIATENLSLDGVLQAPASAEEDPRGGFRHGGWAAGYEDPAIGAFLGEDMARSRGMLFGHRTYDQLVGHWLSVTEPNPFTDVIRAAPKYVCSRRAGTELPHPNSILLEGEAVRTVARLREEIEGDLTVLGSGELLRSLLAAGLVDGLVLMTYPIVLGSGTRLFGQGERVDLALRRAGRSATGVQMAEYAVRPEPRTP